MRSNWFLCTLVAVAFVMLSASGCSMLQPNPAAHPGFHKEFSVDRLLADRAGGRMEARWENWYKNWKEPKDWIIEYPKGTIQFGVNSQEARWEAHIPVVKAIDSLRKLHEKGVEMTEGWVLVASFQTHLWTDDKTQMWAGVYKEEVEKLLAKSDAAASAIEAADRTQDWLEKAKRVDEAKKRLAAFYFVLGQASKYEGLNQGAFQETVGEFPKAVYWHLLSAEVSFEALVESYDRVR